MVNILNRTGGQVVSSPCLIYFIVPPRILLYLFVVAKFIVFHCLCSNGDGASSNLMTECPSLCTLFKQLLDQYHRKYSTQRWYEGSVLKHSYLQECPFMLSCLKCIVYVLPVPMYWQWKLFYIGVCWDGWLATLVQTTQPITMSTLVQVWWRINDVQN